MHDWHIYPEMGGGMLYDWGVHLIDQMLDMVKSKIVSLYADVQNVINENVDDYFKIIMKFENGVTAEIELGTYYLTPKRGWIRRRRQDCPHSASVGKCSWKDYDDCSRAYKKLWTSRAGTVV